MSSRIQTASNEKMQWSAKMFVTAIALCGLAVLGYGLTQQHHSDPARFGCLLLIALIASRLKLKLPGLTGTMSVNLPFILISAAWLSLPEVLVIACSSTVIQSLPKGQKLIPVRVLFNFCSMAIAVALAWFVLNHSGFGTIRPSHQVLLALATSTLFLGNTVPVAMVISLTEKVSAVKAWNGIFHWSFPYYVLSAGVTSLATSASHYTGWQTPVLTLPIMFAVYHSYRTYFGHNTYQTPPAWAKARAQSAGA